FCGNGAAVALGDVDGDAQAEVIVNQESQGELLAFKIDGTQVFDVHPSGDTLDVSPVLEKIDGTTLPDILWPGGFLQHDGTVGLERSLFAQPVAVDVDGDGTQDLVGLDQGTTVFAPFALGARRRDGTLLWASPELITGAGSKRLTRPAVADLDRDGNPD